MSRFLCSIITQASQFLRPLLTAQLMHSCDSQSACVARCSTKLAHRTFRGVQARSPQKRKRTRQARAAAETSQAQEHDKSVVPNLFHRTLKADSKHKSTNESLRQKPLDPLTRKIERIHVPVLARKRADITHNTLQALPKLTLMEQVQRAQ